MTINDDADDTALVLSTIRINSDNYWWECSFNYGPFLRKNASIVLYLAFQSMFLFLLSFAPNASNTWNIFPTIPIVCMHTIISIMMYELKKKTRQHWINMCLQPYSISRNLNGCKTYDNTNINTIENTHLT